jgi:hypothetical protein
MSPRELFVNCWYLPKHRTALQISGPCQGWYGIFGKLVCSWVCCCRRLAEVSEDAYCLSIGSVICIRIDLPWCTRLGRSTRWMIYPYSIQKQKLRSNTISIEECRRTISSAKAYSRPEMLCCWSIENVLAYDIYPAFPQVSACFGRWLITPRFWP